MATRTWNGSDADFSVAADWSPAGVPGTGDIAVINAGTVTLTGRLTASELQLASTFAGSPLLVATSFLVDAGQKVGITAAGANSTLRLAGAAMNRGAYTLSATSPGVSSISLIDAASGPTTFDNQGGVTLLGSFSILRNSGANGANQFLNNGTVALRAVSSGNNYLYLSGALGGSGTVRLNNNAVLEAANVVGAGQTVLFEAGTGVASRLQIDFPDLFRAKLSGFGAADTIGAFTPDWDAYNYTVTTGGGTLTLTKAGSAVSAFNFVGAYTQADFQLTGSGGTTGVATTTIRTTKADAAQTISFTDIVTGVVGSDVAGNYSDVNVPNLQKSYFWGYDTPVAIRADVGNVFLKGGAGGDALQVTGGNNVIDGGGGSNYLIGGTGTDGGADTFFVDGRGNVETWSTILNFHKGDLAVIFGFRQGTSSQDWFDNDGAAGASGYTLHSRLAGTDPGYTGSMTFAGIDRATADAKFEITYGSQAAQGNDYILIRYT